MRENKNFKELLADVEAIVFDVDGVMTDGGIMPLADGDFIRKYNAKDGYALGYAVKHGLNIGVISGGFGKTLESTPIDEKEAFHVPAQPMASIAPPSPYSKLK